jgi:hypothetical protein
MARTIILGNETGRAKPPARKTQESLNKRNTILGVAACLVILLAALLIFRTVRNGAPGGGQNVAAMATASEGRRGLPPKGQAMGAVFRGSDETLGSAGAPGIGPGN